MKEYAERNRVLAEMGYEDYQAYLKSPLWQVIRKRVLMAQPWCHVCGECSKAVHHRSYSRAVLRGEKDDELVGLCMSCHDRIEFSGKWKRTLEGANRALDQAAAEAGKLPKKSVLKLPPESAKKKSPPKPKKVAKAKRKKAKKGKKRPLWMGPGQSVDLADFLRRNGNLNEAQATILGLPWPLRKGWKDALFDREVSPEVLARLDGLVGQKVAIPRLKQELAVQEEFVSIRERAAQYGLTLHLSPTASWSNRIQHWMFDYKKKRVMDYWPSTGTWRGKEESGKVSTPEEALDIAVNLTR